MAPEQPGTVSKKVYEILSLKAVKISQVYTMHIFQCTGKMFLFKISEGTKISKKISKIYKCPYIEG